MEKLYVDIQLLADMCEYKGNVLDNLFKLLSEKITNGITVTITSHIDDITVHIVTILKTTEDITKFWERYKIES